MVKDDERGMMPKNKRTREWFWAYAGSSYPRGQGKRVGHMIVGSNSGVPTPNFNIERVSKETLDRHFSHPGICIAILGDESRVTKELYEEGLFPV